MEQAFAITPEMNREIEDEMQRVLQAPHDAPREMFGAPRIRRREPHAVSDSGSVAQGSQNDLETDPRTSAEIDNDPVNHPQHYMQHPSGVECITVTEWMSFNLGNCVKYIWRAGYKGYQIEDLQKARWYLDREIQRIGGE